jgi:hypothetical protein
MNCKTCNYPLWQITARQCPECGAAFKPSDFEFVLNAVRFCCPHCAQAYYGTGPKGHLVPFAFNCVNCSRPIDMDTMVLLPAANVTETQTTARHVPWAERRTQSWFGAFFSTFGMAMSNPTGLIDALPEGHGLRRPLVYAFINLVVQYVCGLWWFMAFPLVLAMMLAPGVGGWGGSLGFLGSALIGLILAPVLLLAWIGLTHGILRATGPTAGGFTRTAHAICYSSGNNFIAGIPCLGFYFGWAAWLWWAISGGFMLARAQKVGGVRAGVAIGAPGVLAIAAAVAGFIALMTWSGGMAAQAAAPRVVSIPSSHGAPGEAAEAIALALQARSSFSPFVEHAVILLVDRDLEPEDVLIPGSKTATGTTFVNSVPLMSFTFGDSTGLRAATPLRGKTAGQHRVGDFVFVHAGIDPVKGEDGLWLAIGWPDPTSNPGRPAEVEVALTRGQYEIIPIDDFDKRLVEQNSRRWLLVLPPITDPSQTR